MAEFYHSLNDNLRHTMASTKFPLCPAYPSHPYIGIYHVHVCNERGLYDKLAAKVSTVAKYVGCCMVRVCECFQNRSYSQEILASLWIKRVVIAN